MKYLSLFSGIGGFELGIQHALSKIERKQQGGNKGNIPLHGESFLEPQCIGFSEIDKYAVQIYQKHFPDHKNYGDITKIDEATLPDFDLLVGGFPCQSFSIAGKRRGFEDTRGTLFFEIARICRDKQPRLIFLENVKGLLSHDNGQTFATIISTLDELGYDLQWQVLNSKNFGVPQNRERVFIIGHLRGTARPKVFPFGSTDKETHGNPEISQLNNPIHSNDRVYGTAPTLNTMQGGRRQPKIIGGLQGHQIPREDGVSPTLTTAMGQGGGQIPIVISKTVRSGGRASPHGSKQNWDSYEVGNSIRRLTPTECERLQGFPDGWTEGVSDTQRYKCLGNAVTVNVIQAIIEKLLNQNV